MTRLCLTDSSKGNRIVVMEAITEEQEARIDKSKQYFGSIRHTKEDGQIIDGKDIYVYGEINFNSEEDCNILNRFHLLDNDNSFVYYGFNYDKGTIVLKENKVKWYQTTNNIKWLQFNHCLIGKPERIIIYKIDKIILFNYSFSNLLTFIIVANFNFYQGYFYEPILMLSTMFHLRVAVKNQASLITNSL